MHSESFSQLIVHGCLTDPFKVKSGVLQGGILSPLLSILVIDYVMGKVLEGRNYGIQWKLNRKSSDLDYADDIVLMASTVAEEHKILDKLVLEGRKVELVINQKKNDCYVGE